MMRLIMLTSTFIIGHFISCTSTRISHEPFQSLKKLEGTWIMATQKNPIGEKWFVEGKDTMGGFGFYIKGSDTIQTEKLKIIKNGHDVIYTSIVRGQNNGNPVSFTMTSAMNNVFVFENPGHDFPKRISNQLVTKDSVYAYIDAGVDGKSKKLEFFYKRVK